MACNWAYDNPPTNRIVWWIVISITVVGKVLIATGISGGYIDHDCFTKYKNCQDSLSEEQCTEQYDELCHLKTWAGLIIAGVVVWVFGASFTSYFCCCSTPLPNDSAIAMQPLTGAYPQVASGVYLGQAVVGVPVAGYPPPAQQPCPNQGPYAHPPGTWGPPVTPPSAYLPHLSPELTTATIVPPGQAPGTSMWK